MSAACVSNSAAILAEASASSSAVGSGIADEKVLSILQGMNATCLHSTVQDPVISYAAASAAMLGHLCGADLFAASSSQCELQAIPCRSARQKPKVPNTKVIAHDVPCRIVCSVD